MQPKIRLLAFVKATRKWIFALTRPAPVISFILLTAIICLGISIVRADRSVAPRKVVMLTGTTTAPPELTPSEPVEPLQTSPPPAEITDTEPAEQTPPESEWKTVRMRVTAYCPCRICCGRNSDGYTACMHKIKTGDVFVAADKKYRFKTEIIVPGYNDDQPVKVLDRGRVIKGDRLDVFFNSHKTAKKWGVKYLDVKVKK